MKPIAAGWCVFVVALLDSVCIAFIWLKPKLSSIPLVLSDPSISDAILVFGLLMYGVSIFTLLLAFLHPQLRTFFAKSMYLWPMFALITFYVAISTYELQSVLRGQI